MTLKKTSLVLSSLFILGACVAYGLREPVAQGAHAYRFGTVERGDLVLSVSATGTLNPVVSVQVGSQVSGQVRDIHVDFNSEVRRGQLIARIDPEAFRLRVAQAMADLQAARADLMIQHAQRASIRADLAGAKLHYAEAEREARRNQALHEKNFITAAVRDKADTALGLAHEKLNSAEAQRQVSEAQLLSAEAMVKQRESQLAQARVDLQRTEIRAPVDGIVVKKSVEPGQTVAASLQAPELFVIARDLREMQVEASIDESDVNRVQVGQPARFSVDSLPGRHFDGVVQQVRKAPRVLQNVVTYIAIIRASNPELALFPGMTANVRIVAASRQNVLKLPNAALRFQPVAAAQRPDGPVLWMLDERNRLTSVSVRTGMSDGVHTELIAGAPAEGTRVITGVRQDPSTGEKRLFRLRF